MSASAKPVTLERTVTHRLHTLAKLTERATQAAVEAEARLPAHEARCLAAIGAFAPLSVNDLARATSLDKGQASRAAQALVEQGLVRKDASAADARGVVLALSARGGRAWSRVMAVVARRNEEVVAGLSAAERRQLDGLLDRLVAQARRRDEVRPAATSARRTAPPSRRR